MGELCNMYTILRLRIVWKKRGYSEISFLGQIKKKEKYIIFRTV
jgi:hypothetical protein